MYNDNGDDMELVLDELIHGDLWDYDLFLIMVNQQEVGRIVFRRASATLVSISGHVGYHVESEYRGHGYAYQALKLLMKHIAGLGYESIIITCDPLNIPSKKTIEKFKVLQHEIIDICSKEYPMQNQMAIYEIEVEK